MTPNELRALLHETLRQSASGDELHATCLCLKEFADQLLAPQLLSVPQRGIYWRAAYHVYRYLHEARCLGRKRSEDEFIHNVQVHDELTRVERQLMQEGGVPC